MEEKMTDMTFRQFVEETINQPPPKQHIMCGSSFIRDLNRALDALDAKKKKKFKFILLKSRKI